MEQGRMSKMLLCGISNWYLKSELQRV